MQPEAFKASPVIDRLRRKMPKPTSQTRAWHTLSNAEREEIVDAEMKHRETHDKYAR
jgi:hypothetical protein